jgi:beta-phosphoglucomutase-like phosphatase (HAD superfamily)
MNIIFDMDGVLFDSEQAYIDAYRSLITRAGYPFYPQACIESIGTNWIRTEEIYHKYYGDDFDFRSFHAAVRGMVTGEDFSLKPGVFDILDWLMERDARVALASSTREELVRRMLDSKGLADYFDVIVCGDMVAHSKPHPEIFLSAASRLQADPSACYVIEDSFNGIRCAHNAGMHPIMVPDIVQPDEEIRALAEVVLPSLYDVIAYLEERHDL